MLQNGRLQVARINEISEKGLSFLYDGQRGANSGESVVVDILFLEEDIFWHQIPCSIVSDQPVEGMVPLNMHYRRRCGVMFEDLNSSQLLQLNAVVLQK